MDTGCFSLGFPFRVVGSRGLSPTFVTQRNLPPYMGVSLWEALLIVSQKWAALFPLPSLPVGKPRQDDAMSVVSLFSRFKVVNLRAHQMDTGCFLLGFPLDQPHRCPFWLVCSTTRGPWLKWSLFHLPGPCVFSQKALMIRQFGLLVFFGFPIRSKCRGAAHVARHLLGLRPQHRAAGSALGQGVSARKLQRFPAKKPVGPMRCSGIRFRWLF